MIPVRMLLAVGLVLGLAVEVRAGKSLAEIKPGPQQQSEKEMAIEADPGAGVEHAVILIEEYERDADRGLEMQTRYHMRAKILSNEGRDLADIEIPMLRRGGRLARWWGRTIQPDGSVLELEREDLERQLLARTSRGKLEAIKAALPGVAPGSVIDYGFTIREDGYVPFDSVPLQRQYRTDLFRYAWRPFSGFNAAFYLSRSDELDIEHRADANSVVVEARNLPPAVSEPMMPPLDATRAMLYLYYTADWVNYQSYWNQIARRTHVGMNLSVKKGSVRKALEEIAPAPGGDLEARLRALYDWVGQNIEREGLRSFEEQRAEQDEGKDHPDIVRRLMENRRGSVYEIDVFYIALARAMGADARLVYAVDRTDNYLNTDVKSMKQFQATLVAIAEEGAIDPTVVLDPGCGLPYGQVPWWLGGVRAMMAGKKTMDIIRIPMAGPDGSVATARAEIEYADDNEMRTTTWSHRSSGQEGMSRLRHMRRLSPAEREREREERCSTGPESDVFASRTSSTDTVSDQFELLCEVEEWVDLEDRIERYHLGFLGPWIHDVPDLPDAPRTFPVVARYPRFEEAVVVLHAPSGFAPGEAPEPVDLQTEFGRYTLEVATTDTGFEVTRRLALTAVGISVDGYVDFRQFLEDVRRHDRSSVVFERERDG